jgi:hypothetical protein
MSVRHSLELSVIGNSNINALIDRSGSIVWRSALSSEFNIELAKIQI